MFSMNANKSCMEDVCLYQYVKIALAVTVIKRKPSNLDVRTYLQELVENMKLQDGNRNKNVAEWEKMLLERQHEWMSVLLSENDLDKGVEPSSLYFKNESSSRIQTHERSMQLLKSEKPFTVDGCLKVKTKMERLMDSLMKHLLRWKSVSEGVVSTEIRDILLSIGSSALFRDVCLLRLSWHLHTFAASLKLVTKGDLEFSCKVLAYQNIFHVLCLLEELLQETCQINLCSETVSSVYHQLSSSLMHISQAFPVFSHFLWRLQVLLMQLSSFSKPQDKPDFAVEA